MRARLGTCLVGILLVLALVGGSKPNAWAASPSPKPLLADATEALYRQAFELIEQKQYDSGLQLARRGGHPLATKIADWLDLSRRDSDRGFAEIQEFLAANPDWPRRFALFRNAEQSLPADWSPQSVVAWFGSRPPITGTGALALGQAHLALGRSDDLRTLAPRLWVSIDFEAEEESQFHNLMRGYLSREDQERRLSRLLWDRRTTAAQRQIRRVSSAEAALARARIALYRNQRGVDAAIRRVPEHLHGNEGLLYERAVWRQRRSRFEGVVEILKEAPRQGEHLASWWRLRRWASRQAMDRSQWALAYQLARQHGFKDGLGFAEGEWLAGWIALTFLHRPEAALEHFARLHGGVTSPISKSRGAYWSGEANRILGKDLEAQRWYTRAQAFPRAFYGQLAAQRTETEVSAALAIPVEIAEDTETAFLNKEFVQAARLLGQTGQPKLQESFIARLRQDAKSNIDFQLVIALANSLGRQELAIRAAKTARRRGFDMSAFLYPRLAFPDSTTVERALVLAVMRQESEFYPKARSPVGALGLMQLMPATAKQTARRQGLPYDRKRLTNDPNYNIRLGQAYLAELLDRYGGSYVLALAAYNAGPARVERWMTQFGDPQHSAIDPVQWIERIPFQETRNYVQRILESLVVYREIEPASEIPWALEISPAGS